MNQRVTPDELTNAIMDVLEDFKNATDEVCEEAVSAAAKEAVNELRNVHVDGAEKYGSWDNYRKSWKSRKKTKDKWYHAQATVYNEKYYRLTHLLEKGHALPQGGRSKAYPHIAPIADKAEETLFRKVRDGI